MQHFRSRFTVIVSLLFFSSLSFAETFDEYVATCKDQLDFDTIPSFSCKGVNFRKPTDVAYLGLDFSQSSDWVGHARVTDAVDAVFACRWVEQGGADAQDPVAGEMIVHNRKTGGTCFFELKDSFRNRFYPQVSTFPVPPTYTGASSIWSVGGRCTQCHAAGPYIASPQIVGALAKFGLINDGHDTFNKDIADKGYHAVGANNATPNSYINNSTQRSCANACHVMGGSPIVESEIGTDFVPNAVVMPSINHVIDDIDLTNKMPPTDPNSDYRWLNRDSPSGTGDYETLLDFKYDHDHDVRDFSAFYCDTPTRMEAHEVDSSTIYKVDKEGISALQKLYKFNLYDGLICRDQDQPSGPGQPGCFSYSTRYKCDGAWTEWQNNNPVDSTQDDESRSRFRNLCSNPTEIEGRYRAPTNEVVYVAARGPRDRLSQFDNKGLACRNQDQPTGKTCHNYTVRFFCN